MLLTGTGKSHLDPAYSVSNTLSANKLQCLHDLNGQMATQPNIIKIIFKEI